MGFDVGKQAFGVSLDADGDAGGDGVPEVESVNGVDVVTAPSAGGGFAAVLESWTGFFNARGGGDATVRIFDRLIKVLPKRKEFLEGLIPEKERDKFSFVALEKQAPEVLQEFLEAVQPKPGDGGEPKKTKKDEPVRDPRVDALLLESALKDSGLSGETTQALREKFAGKEYDKPVVAAAILEAQEALKKKKAEKKEGDGDGKAKKPAITEGDRRLDALLLESTLKDSGLGDDWKQDIRERFAGRVFDPLAVNGAIAGTKKRLAALTRATEPVAPAFMESISPFGQGSDTPFDKIVAGLDAFFDGKEEYLTPREAYIALTGDSTVHPKAHVRRFLEGKAGFGILESVGNSDEQVAKHFPGLVVRAKRAKVPILEAIATSGYAEITADRMHKRMVAEYRQSDLTTHMLIADVEEVEDFQIHRRIRMGEFADLDAIAGEGSGNPYTAFATPADEPTDEEVTLQLGKYGNTLEVNWEATLNDDVGAFRRIPEKLGRAARRTEHKDVLGMLELNSNIYDATALGTAGHGNNQAVALSEASAWLARQQLSAQQDMDSRHVLGLRAAWLFHGPDLTELAAILTASLNRPGSLQPAAGFDGTAQTHITPTLAVGNMPGSPEVNPVQRMNLQTVEVPYWAGGAASADAYMIANKSDVPLIEVIFLRGRRNPELYVQDLPTVGSFFDADVTTIKVRHIWDKAVKDFRGFQRIAP